MTHSALLSDLVDLHVALRADALELDAKKRRDRRIGAELQSDKGRPERQLRGWLARVDVPGWRREGHKATQLYQLMGLGLAALGLLAGWGLARAALHYTGAEPINVVNVLVVLILPQLLLLLLWLISAMPVRLPLLAGLQSALAFLNPGRLARLVLARFPFTAERRLEVIWDPENAVALAPAARWLVSLWSQLFSVAFNLGALLAVFYLISFSDLAFGWSSTLALDSATFHRVVGALAWPWQGLFPQAVPGAELVEASRYYRLETGAIGAGTTAPQAALLGRWWPFLVAALVCYGLLPRLLTLAVSWQRFRHHLRVALVRLPGAPELLARMNSPLVSTAALQPEAAAAEAGAARPPEHPLHAKTRCTVVAWSGSVDALEDVGGRLQGLGVEPLELVHAGGAQTTVQDQAVIRGLCRQSDAGVAIIAKAWEPPLLEFLDFLQQVRAHCSRGQPVIVLLWGASAPVDDADAEVWRLTLRQLGDPDLHLEVIP